jgi:hypothetical protein
MINPNKTHLPRYFGLALRRALAASFDVVFVRNRIAFTSGGVLIDRSFCFIIDRLFGSFDRNNKRQEGKTRKAKQNNKHGSSSRSLLSLPKEQTVH